MLTERSYNDAPATTNCDKMYMSGLGPKTGLAIYLYMIMLHWWCTPILAEVLTCGSSVSYIRRVWKKILWSCVIIVSPGLIGRYAIYDYSSGDPEDRLRIYLHGLPEEKSGDEQQSGGPDITIVHNQSKVALHEICIHLVSIGLSIYPTIQLFKLGITCGPTGDLLTVMTITFQQLQYYLALPNAIIGFWILLDARLFRLRQTKISLAICFCLLTAVMIALAIATSLFSKNNRTDVPTAGFVVPMVGLVYASLPFYFDVLLISQAMFIFVNRPVAIYVVRGLNGHYLPFTDTTWFTVITFIFAFICVLLAGYCWYTTGERVKKHRAQKKLERCSNSITEQCEGESEEDREKQGVVIVEAVEQREGESPEDKKKQGIVIVHAVEV